jgi:hypothetical protein
MNHPHVVMQLKSGIERELDSFEELFYSASGLSGFFAIFSDEADDADNAVAATGS